MYISSMESMSMRWQGNVAPDTAAQPTARVLPLALQQASTMEEPTMEASRSTTAVVVSASSEEEVHAANDAGGFDDDDLPGVEAQPLGPPSTTPPLTSPRSPEPDFHPPPPLSGGPASHLWTSLTPSHLPEVVVAPRVALPAVVSLAKRPGPPLPGEMADGVPLPRSAFNPFLKAAPRGTWEAVAKSIPRCAHALLGKDGSGQLLMIHIDTIKASVNLDVCMSETGYEGFCIHSDRDVLLCGLRKDLSQATFLEVARQRDSTWVVENANAMEGLIAASAKRLSTRFTIHDDYTTGFGYSTTQQNRVGTAAAPETLARAIARGGLTNLHFRNVPRRCNRKHWRYQGHSASG